MTYDPSIWLKVKSLSSTASVPKDTQPILKLIGESLFRKIYFSYSEKCPSEYTAICPSEQIPEKCPSEHDAMCPSEHELEVIQN